MQTKKISDVSISVSSGSTPLRSNQEFWEKGTVPWLKTEQLGEKNIFEANEKITELALKRTGLKKYPPNTISIAMYGEGKTRGSVSIIKKEMTTNQACCNIILDGNQAHFEYVYYFLKTQYKELRALSSGVRKNLNSNDIKNFKIRLPVEIKEQKKTIAILSAIDSKIDLNNRINAELEAMAKTLYDYWFVQFDFPDENSKPYKSSGGEMVYNEVLKREIPAGWEVTPLASWIGYDKTGDWGSDKPEGNYKLLVSCIRGTDINGINGLENASPPTRFILEKNSTKILEPYDIVIEISGGSPSQSTGRQAFITGKTIDRFANPLICSNFCKAIRLEDDTFFYNFIYLWNSIYENKILFGWEGKTSGIKNLLFEAFVNHYQVYVPPSDLARKFSNFVVPIQEKKQINLKENQQLIELRDWLLPMLMNGQVTVV